MIERAATRRASRPPASGQPLGLALDRARGAPPLYRQLCDGLRASMLAGALGAGTRLPPERELAAALGVNRSTVMHAYQELAADGLVEARPGRGTVVCAPAHPDLAALGPRFGRTRSHSAADAPWLLGLPAFGNGNLGPEPGLLRDLASLSERDDIISFAAGAPARDLLPLAALSAALQRGLAESGAMALGYTPVEGLPSLRQVLAERLVARGRPARPPEVLVTSGATQGLALAAQALIEPGDSVVVEAPTYVGLLQAFGAAGARLIGIPVDEHGLRVDLLAPILARRTVRLIVVQATLHNPTGATMSQDRRERLLALARLHSIPILDDDAYGELWHTDGGPPPLQALDRHGLVLHLGTFSKTAAPGLRVGWLAAPAPVIARLALAKQFADMLTNGPGQLAIQGFLESGAYDDHLERMRVAYAERRAAMLAGLSPAARHLQVLPGGPGSFYLWCRLTAGRARLLAAAAVRAGVALVAGEAFYPPGVAEDGHDRIRLSYAYHDPATVAEGLRRLLPVLASHAELQDTGRQRGLCPVV